MNKNLNYKLSFIPNSGSVNTHFFTMITPVSNKDRYYALLAVSEKENLLIIIT